MDGALVFVWIIQGAMVACFAAGLAALVTHALRGNFKRRGRRRR